MKYLKLFRELNYIRESFLEKPKFYRFTIEETAGIDGDILKPRNRKLDAENSNWNSVLIENGFPNMSKSSFIMDEIAREIYKEKNYKPFGNNEYQINLDDESNLGWSFFVMQGKWHSKTPNYFTEYYPERNKYKLPDELVNKRNFVNWSYERQINPTPEKYAKLLLKHKVIGKGKIKELMMSPFWGKVPCYIWTDDKIKINKI
jgi:hypothetical protein